MGKEVGASLSPESYMEGGGLINDVDVRWKECRFELWDYNGKVPVAVPALKVTMDVIGDDEAVEVVQYFSAGNAKDWTPSKDGRKLVSVGAASGITKTSNLAILITSLIEAKFPPDKIEEDCTIFEGMEAHMVRVKAPERKGLVRTPRADGKEYESQNLVVDKILKFPWDKKVGKDTGKATEKESSGPSGEDMTDKAQNIIMEILEKNPKGLDKKKLTNAVFNALKTDSDRNEIVKMVYDEEFLKTGPWSYEKGVVGG